MPEKPLEGSSTFLLEFAPELWTPLDRLRWLSGPPFPEKGPYVEGLFMTRAHLGKYEVLASLANRLAPELSRDEEELKRQGFTPALRSREFAALTETLICELYYVLGGLRLLLCGAYPKASLPGKTSRLFQNAVDGKIGSHLPDEIRSVLVAAHGSWFPLLRSFRTTVVHRDSGSVHFLTETGCARYVHAGFIDGPRPFVTDDIVTWVNERRNHVQAVVEEIATFLGSRLLPAERRVICGMYRSRGYQRVVMVGPELTRESGRCISREWFESEIGRECPLRGSCKAYLAETR
jgi:hypothetical protein